MNFTSFYEALLNAKGIDLGGSAAMGKGGRTLSYTAKVQGNGNLLVGKAYTAMLDLQPGDEFEIKLGKKAVRLIPVGAEEETEEWERLQNPDLTNWPASYEVGLNTFNQQLLLSNIRSFGFRTDQGLE